MLVALEEKLRDPQVTYIYIFFYPLGTMNVYTKFNGNWCKSCWSAWVPSKVEDQWIHIYWATPAWWKINSRYTIKKKKKQWRKRLQIISLHICGEESSNIHKTHCWIWQISKGELDEFFWKLIRWGVNDECGQREKNTKDRLELTLTLSPFVRMSQSVCWNLVRSIWWPPPNNAWGEQVRIKQSTF